MEDDYGGDAPVSVNNDQPLAPVPVHPEDEPTATQIKVEARRPGR